MTRPPNALPLARLLIRGLIVLNALYACAIGLLLVATLLYPKLLFDALVGLDGADAWQVRVALRAVVIVGIAGAYVVYRVLRELLAIVDTVRDGDPFVAGNARRLQAIAWWVLAGEGLRLLVGAIVWGASRFVPAIDNIDVGFSFAPWLAVLLLFVLARVFDEGTRMRADLEGTV
ncbi:hypothetical protein GCM10027431_12610 [Lysobacter rhizosphaerae]